MPTSQSHSTTAGALPVDQMGFFLLICNLWHSRAAPCQHVMALHPDKKPHASNLRLHEGHPCFPASIWMRDLQIQPTRFIIQLLPKIKLNSKTHEDAIYNILIIAFEVILILSSSSPSWMVCGLWCCLVRYCWSFQGTCTRSVVNCIGNLGYQ